jgi:hypothetical protein
MVIAGLQKVIASSTAQCVARAAEKVVRTPWTKWSIRSTLTWSLIREVGLSHVRQSGQQPPACATHLAAGMLFPQPLLEAPQRPRQVLVSVRFDTMAAQLRFEIKSGRTYISFG